MSMFTIESCTGHTRKCGKLLGKPVDITFDIPDVMEAPSTALYGDGEAIITIGGRTRRVTGEWSEDTRGWVTFDGDGASFVDMGAPELTLIKEYKAITVCGHPGCGADPVSVPEPSSTTLLAMGLAALILVRAKKRIQR